MSPLGKILLSADENNITGLYFEGQKFYPAFSGCEITGRDNDILKAARKWLDIYFSGEEPNFKIPVKLDGTEFQKKVWNILLTVPYGKTITYKDIAGKLLSDECRMSSRAVGGAVSRNKISIIVPCHRVIGADEKITGYAAGIEKKIKLLKMENTELKDNI